jgi:hypothetical protein
MSLFVIEDSPQRAAGSARAVLFKMNGFTLYISHLLRRFMMTAVYPLFRVFVSPFKTFQSLTESSRAAWIPPFVLCALLSILVALGVEPIMQAILTNNLPPGAEMAQKATPQSPSPLVAPVGVMIRWLVNATFLWLLIHLVSAPARFSTVFTVVAYAFTVVAIGDALGVAMIHYQGVERVSSPLALYGDFGLNRIIPGSYSMAVESLLRSVTLFSVWHLALLTIGLTVMAGIKPARAFLVSLIVWLFPALLGAASFSFFEQIRSLAM